MSNLTDQEKIDYITQKLIDPSTEESMIGALLTEVIKHFSSEVLNSIISKFEESQE